MSEKIPMREIAYFVERASEDPESVPHGSAMTIQLFEFFEEFREAYWWAESKYGADHPFLVKLYNINPEWIEWWPPSKIKTEES